MSRQLGHYDHHSKNGHLSVILKELFAFLDPYAELKYQKDLLMPRKQKDSTRMIQEELLRGELLLDAITAEEDTTEEEW